MYKSAKWYMLRHYHWHYVYMRIIQGLLRLGVPRRWLRWSTWTHGGRSLILDNLGMTITWKDVIDEWPIP